MFIDTYLVIPLWIFAIYGFLYFIYRLFMSTSINKQHKNGFYTLVISAKNREEVIEGIIRGFILKNGLDSSEEQLLTIVLVDLGSNDRTPRIMEKLCQEYTFIRLIKPDDLKTFFLNTMSIE